MGLQRSVLRVVYWLTKTCVRKTQCNVSVACCEGYCELTVILEAFCSSYTLYFSHLI